MTSRQLIFAVSRAAVALLVVFAHVLAVSHAAAVAHVVTVSGEVVHAHADGAVGATHLKHSGASWCDEGLERTSQDGTVCLAAKLGPAGRGPVSGSLAAVVERCTSQPAHAFRFSHAPLSALGCAPKASPPLA